MFWWMHFTKAVGVSNFTERPIIFWLQGGPGSSSTGYGNFEILGPLDLHEKERNFSWINSHNVSNKDKVSYNYDKISFKVLFVDNPVGKFKSSFVN